MLALPAVAGSLTVKVVPASTGDPLAPHSVLANRLTTLKATSSISGPGIEATWDFGDSSPTETFEITNRHDVSARHSYTGQEGAGFNATLTVRNKHTGESAKGIYRVAIRERSLEIEAIIAIDEGLWYLHKTMNRRQSGDLETGDWRGACGRACKDDGSTSAANVLAFESSGFLETGSPDNPYSETVAHARRSLAESSENPTVQLAKKLAAVGDTRESAEDRQLYRDHQALINTQDADGFWPQSPFATSRAVAALASRIPPAAVSTIFNVSSQVSVTTSGFLYSRTTRTYNGTLTVMNTSLTSIAGPVNVVLTNLPPGVTLVNAAGTFNGNPFITLPGVGTLNAGQSATVNLSFNNPSNVVITSVPVTYSGTFPPAPVTLGCPANTGANGVPYTSALLGEGGVQQYVYSVGPGSLPTGLNLNAATGAIVGTPTTNGAFNFTATLVDGTGLPSGTATTNCTITITPPVGPLILGCPANSGQVGVAYSSALAASGGVPGYTYSIIAGALPAPLILNPATGAITGTPDTAGPFSFTAQVTDSAGTPQSIQTPCGITISGAATVAITIDTVPTGLSVIIDGSTLTAPQVVNWVPASSHTIATTTLQGSGGTRYVFSNWSDSGAISHTVTAPASPATFTANFNTEYQLTTAASPSGGGTVTPASGSFFAAGSVQNVTATANSGFTFTNWTGPVANANAASTTVTMSGPVSITANFTAQVGITVTTAPPGLSIIVDGNTLTAPQVFNWTPGSSHTIATTTPQGSGGTRYVFNNWSDAGAISHTVTAPASATTFTASFDTQYQLTTAASPVAGGTVTPASGAFFPAGSVQNVTATANAGFTFNNWTGPVANANAASTTVNMSGPVSITGNFSATVGITVTTSPAGLSIIVDGNTLTAPQVFNWTPGSNHTIATTSPQGSGGTRNVFTSWSDGGAISHSVTAPASTTTFTATFGTEFQLTTAASPAGGGIVTPASGSFFTAGSLQNVTATANAGFVFNGWTGPVASATSTSTTVTMSGPVSVTANFATNATVSCPAATTANIGTPYSSSITGSGGTPPYTFAIQSGTLPPPLTLNASNGLISGTPSTKGNYSFVARLADSTSPIQQVRTASCSILVPNRLPTATARTASTNEDTAVVIALAATDPDGDPLTFSLASGPTNGTATSFGAGTCAGVPSNCTRNITYTPGTNFNGSANFTFLVNDGEGNSSAATVTITVNPGNDAPTAAVKAYNAQANMRIVVPAASGLLVGATDPDSVDAGFTPVFTVGTVSSTTPAGGVVSINPGTGAFNFDPPPGVTGNVSFTYTVCDNGRPTPSACSAPAAVTVAVAGPVIWFVNTAGGAGNGTLLTPFNTLAAANTAMGSNTNHTIFVYSGTTASGTGVTLLANSRLIGQGVTGASFDVVMGITPPVTTIARPSIGGTAPIIQGTVNMNGNSTSVRGLRIQPPSSTAGLAATLTGPFAGLLVSDIPNITTSSARAVNLNNVSGTFSITAVNASNADIGLNLNNVNPSTGSFAVLGNGGTCTAATPTCTGGTISSPTDTGIRLNNTRNVTLTRMRLNGSPNFGLNGTTVHSMAIDTCVFDGAHGNATNEGALYVTNWLTSGTISNSEILGGANDTVRIVNNQGVLNRLTVSNSIIRDNSSGINGNHGMRFAVDVPAGTGAGVVMNLTVTGSTFRNNRSNHFDSGLTGQATMDLVLNNNTFTTVSPYVTLAGAVNITNDHQSDLTFDVNGNTSTGAQLSAFNFFQSNLATAAASMIGRFRNNIIGTTGVAGSGSFQGDGVSFTSTGLAALTTNVTGNTIRQFTNMGIVFTAGDTSPVVNATVTGNTVKEGHPTLALNGIHFNMGTTMAGAVTACADIGGAGALVNNVSSAVPGGTGEIRVRQRNSSTFRLPGLTGAVDAFLAGRNTVTNTAAVTFSGTFAGGAACTQAP